MFCLLILGHGVLGIGVQIKHQDEAGTCFVYTRNRCDGELEFCNGCCTSVLRFEMKMLCEHTWDQSEALD